jgi:hypothetical protein
MKRATAATEKLILPFWEQPGIPIHVVVSFELIVGMNCLVLMDFLELLIDVFQNPSLFDVEVISYRIWKTNIINKNESNSE